jgi:hypothetical protein
VPLGVASPEAVGSSEALGEDEPVVAVLHDAARVLGRPHGVDLGEFGVDAGVLAAVARDPDRGAERRRLLRVVPVERDREGGDRRDRGDPRDERHEPAQRPTRRSGGSRH